MSGWVKCEDCGMEYHSRNDHDCPGSPGDRCSELEQRVDFLERELRELRDELNALRGRG